MAVVVSGTVGRDRGALVVVDDPADARLAEYRDLTDPEIRRRLEAEWAIVVVEGIVAARRLLQSPVVVRSLLVDDRQLDSAADLVEAARARGAPVYVARPDVVAATVGFALHRGVVAIGHRPAAADPVAVLADAARTPSMGGGRPLLAVLEGLNDHENIGALFRNAAAFGIAAVLLDPTCADPLYRRSIRVSVGYALQVPFARLAPWPDTLRQVRAAGFLVAALAPQVDVPAGGRVPIPVQQLQARLADPAPASSRGATNSAGPGVALVLGSEGPGLSGAALEAADEVVSIPMAPGVDSLNVATAAAVAFHRLSGL